MNLSGAPITEGRLHLPVSGAWYGEFSLDSESAPSGRATIELEGENFIGTVVRGGMRYGHARVLVVGGAGGLGKNVRAKFYSDSPAQIVATGLLGEVGEQLSSEADSGMLGTVLRKWSVRGSAASMGLDTLCAHLGASWRVQPDGSVWIGEQSWPTLALPHEVTDTDPAAGWVEILSEQLRLRPGVSFEGLRVGAVEFRISPSRLRTRLWEST